MDNKDITQLLGCFKKERCIIQSCAPTAHEFAYHKNYLRKYYKGQCGSYKGFSWQV